MGLREHAPPVVEVERVRDRDVAAVHARIAGDLGAERRLDRGAQRGVQVGYASSKPVNTLTTLRPITSRQYPPSCANTVGSSSAASAPPMRVKSSACSSKRSGSSAAVSTPSDTTTPSGAKRRTLVSAASSASEYRAQSVPRGSGKFRVAPSPAPQPRSSANPRKNG